MLAMNSEYLIRPGRGGPITSFRRASVNGLFWNKRHLAESYRCSFSEDETEVYGAAAAHIFTRENVSGVLDDDETVRIALLGGYKMDKTTLTNSLMNFNGEFVKSVDDRHRTTGNNLALGKIERIDLTSCIEKGYFASDEETHNRAVIELENLFNRCSFAIVEHANIGRELFHAVIGMREIRYDAIEMGMLLDQRLAQTEGNKVDMDKTYHLR